MDVAIIGHAFNLPGAKNLREFGELIFGAKDAFRSSDAGREDTPRWVSSAGYPDDLYRFDYKLFGISLRDSLIVEPQQRMFIQHCWRALENAGYNPTGMESEVGVYSTSSDSKYSEVLGRFRGLLDKYDPFELEVGTNKEQQALRTSYLLNLKGPSFNVQSACSSGLLTVHVAIQALRSGDCDVALAGGACLPIPLHQGYVYREGMNLSRSGTSRSFDASADGMVPGFGCVVFVLKILDQAIRDGDRIYAVIRGSAVNNDGRIKSTYTSPSAKSIERNIKKLFSSAGASANDVDFIEAHGSATKIGDVIEAGALRLAFSGSDRPNMSTAVSSVKSAIGHLDTVAGLAGLLKAMLQVWRGKIAPASNFSRLNENISFIDTPLYVPTSASSVKKLCGVVNSLGIGGTNCAILVQSPDFERDTELEADEGNAWDVYIGAKDGERLRHYAADLRVELADTEWSLRDIAWTLSRRAIGKNLVVNLKIKTRDELLRKLEQLEVSAPDGAPGGAVRGVANGIAVAIESSEIDRDMEVNVESNGEIELANEKTGIHDRLAEIWRENLMIRDVVDNTSFLNEGGHSILALSFIDDLKKYFHIDIDMEWMEENDLFINQIKSIQSLLINSVSKSNIKVLKPAQGELKARLVLIHASISGCDAYKALAQHLNPGVEVVGVDSHNLYADENTIIADIDELVGKYCVDVRNSITDRSTPMIIGGWSLGGMMSNLASERLREWYNVAGLIALDSVIYDSSYQDIFSSDNLSYFVDPSSVLGRDRDQSNGQVKRLKKVFDIERKMAVSFRPAVCDMPLLNVVATEARNKISDRNVRASFDLAKIDNGWKSATPLKTVHLKTFHDGIVGSENSEIVAALMNEFIDEYV